MPSRSPADDGGAAAAPATFPALRSVLACPAPLRSVRWRSALSSPSAAALGLATNVGAVTSKRNVVKMTMSVIAGFVLCWTPYFVVSLIRIYSDYRYQLTTALSVSELMALGHSTINPLLYIVFSTRAVRASFQQLRKRVLPQCCLRRRGLLGGRGQGQAARRPWVVTPEPSTASGDGDRRVGSCMVCRRKRLEGNVRGMTAQRVAVFSSHQRNHNHHHHHHQCYPPHHQTPQQQQQPQPTTQRRRADNGFRATTCLCCSQARTTGS